MPLLITFTLNTNVVFPGTDTSQSLINDYNLANGSFQSKLIWTLFPYL